MCRTQCHPCQRRLVGGKARHRAIHHQARDQAWHLGRHALRHGGLRMRGDQHPGAAVGHDMRRVIHVQARADAHVDQPRALRAPAQLEQARVVLQQEGHAVARLQPVVAEQPRRLVGALVKLAVSNDGAAGHDDGRLVRGALRMNMRVHD